VRTHARCGLIALTAIAAPSAQSQLDSTNARLDHVRALIAAARAREATLGAQVAGYDGQLAATGARLAAIAADEQSAAAKLTRTRARLTRLRHDLETMRRELRVAERRLAAEQDVFERRVTAAYKQGGVDYLDVLVGSNGFGDFVTRLSFVRDLSNYENAFVGQLAATRSAVAAQRGRIAVRAVAATKTEADLERQTARLADLRAQAQQQYGELAAARDAKAGVLAEATGARKAYEAQARELQADSARLAAAIAGAGSVAAQGTGQLMWPVSGPVTCGFGWRVHPIFHTREFHTGIDIGVGAGTPIHAADAGTVIIAAVEGGYGNVIVIDHGGGLSTLYAHQSSFAVTGGQVDKGQVIGYVGSTGFSTGPHLHFEVRRDGQPVDPMGYLH